jgi:hypothetical protein
MMLTCKVDCGELRAPGAWQSMLWPRCSPGRGCRRPWRARASSPAGPRLTQVEPGDACNHSSRVATRSLCVRHSNTNSSRDCAAPKAQTTTKHGGRRVSPGRSCCHARVVPGCGAPDGRAAKVHAAPRSLTPDAAAACRYGGEQDMEPEADFDEVGRPAGRRVGGGHPRPPTAIDRRPCGGARRRLDLPAHPCPPLHPGRPPVLLQPEQEEQMDGMEEDVEIMDGEQPAAAGACLQQHRATRVARPALCRAGCLGWTCPATRRSDEQQHRPWPRLCLQRTRGASPPGT